PGVGRVAQQAIGAITDELVVLLNHNHRPEEASQGPHSPDPQGNATPHGHQADEQQWPPAARELGGGCGPREQEGAANATPEANADAGPTPLIRGRVNVDPLITYDEADPDGHPDAKVEPKQDH